MTDKPILFSGPMVRAILAGHKTQTRRVIKPIKSDGSGYVMWPVYGYTTDMKLRRCGTSQSPERAASYAPGDRLWVREAWRTISGLDDMSPRDLSQLAPIFYETERSKDCDYGRLRPSIHMPRWASRITLLVTGVKVERLQDITEADALAEGVEKWGEATWKNYASDGVTHVVLRPKESFRTLWISINGPGSWDENPWVAAYTFERIEP
jgi:hypothetical protein